MHREKIFWDWADQYPYSIEKSFGADASMEPMLEGLIERGILEKHSADGCQRPECAGIAEYANEISETRSWHYEFTPEQKVLRALRFADAHERG